ncbi:mitochondrial uncoupling protein 3-like [Lotus japonicus]|uniref:mitochondrial uncoupling protein 3-like n=1 Tax=Lotus japonicus TaxID=34305 RepID=UPI002584E4E0|nr:mitochondrial uncoupling protein 3-like [Lotus japonicus]
MKSGQQHGGVDSTTTTLVLSSLSATVAETITFPIDLIKTRLQLHRESLSSSCHTSTFRIGLNVIREQGPLGLYKGLSPAIIRHLFYTPIRIVGYEHLRSVVSPDNGSLSMIGKAFVGGISGSLAQVVASPADVVKVRMQADDRMVREGLQPRYSGSLDALRKIVQAEGLKGLWKGVFPNIQSTIRNMGELAFYDHAKQIVIKSRIAEDNVYAHTLASIMSGLAATSLSCPADVVKTRMMNQVHKKEGQVLYRSSYDCLVKTVKFEGIRALWKGFFPTWARLGPWQFVFWVSYEKLRKLAGLSSF